MGSDTDFPVMSEAAKTLEKFGIPYELEVVSAHRTPARAHEYATTASKRGLKVLIAAAGAAAPLAGGIARKLVAHKQDLERSVGEKNARLKQQLADKK